MFFNRIFLLVLSLFPLITTAQSEITLPENPGESITTVETLPTRPVENKKNYFGVRLGTGLGTSESKNDVTVSDGTPQSIYFGRRIHPQFIIGATLSKAESTTHSQSGYGPSNLAQYYKTNSGFKSTSAEVNLTYFARNEGYKKFGFLLRTGLGIEQGSISGYFTRYDDDPAWIHTGDGKRLQETGPTQTADFSRPYVRIEPAFQFFWAPMNGTIIGGHTLELGASLSYSNLNPTVTYDQPNGEKVAVQAGQLMSNLNISYVIVF